MTDIARITAERDEAQAEVERLRRDLTAADGTIDRLRTELAEQDHDLQTAREDVRRLTSERDAAQAEAERLTVRLEHAQARIVPPLPHADESAQQVQDKMDGYIASLTTELHETREKLARVQVQYDEFAKVTAKVIDKHQRERDHARQQVYLLQQAGADRPSDEDIWREAYMSQLHDRYWASSELADRALAEYRKRWPR